MLYYKVTVNGNTYEVGVEEMSGAPEVKAVQSAPSAPVAAPVAASVTKAAAAQEPPVAAKAAPPVVPAADALDVMAPLPGTVISVNVSVGEKVKASQVLIVFEAMKMENELVAPKAGTIVKIHVAKGDMLESGKAVVSIA